VPGRVPGPAPGGVAGRAPGRAFNRASGRAPSGGPAVRAVHARLGAGAGGVGAAGDVAGGGAGARVGGGGHAALAARDARTGGGGAPVAAGRRRRLGLVPAAAAAGAVHGARAAEPGAVRRHVLRRPGDALGGGAVRRPAQPRAGRGAAPPGSLRALARRLPLVLRDHLRTSASAVPRRAALGLPRDAVPADAHVPGELPVLHLLPRAGAPVPVPAARRRVGSRPRLPPGAPDPGGGLGPGCGVSVLARRGRGRADGHGGAAAAPAVAS